MEKKYLKIIYTFLLFCFPLFSLAATLSINPQSGTYEAGQEFTVRVIASSPDPFNAVSLSILFPPEIFSVDSVSKANSLLSFWVTEPSIPRSDGIVKLEGVTPGGIKQMEGTIVTATLHGIHEGSGVVSFQSGQILANDGQGTDITGDLNGAKFTITAAIAPKRKPEPVVSAPATPKPVPQEPSQAPPTLNAPEVMIGTKYGAQAVIGTTEYPRIAMLVTFISADGTKIFITGNADESGTFTLIVPRSLKRGNYTVMARVIKDDGTNSKDSNTIMIAIGFPFSDLDTETLIALALLVFVILYLTARIFFHLRKDMRKREKREKETREAERVLHESMDVLKEELTEHMQTKIKNIDHKKTIGINKDINDVETIIKKEIKDIDTEEE